MWRNPGYYTNQVIDITDVLCTEYSVGRGEHARDVCADEVPAFARRQSTRCQCERDSQLPRDLPSSVPRHRSATF